MDIFSYVNSKFIYVERHIRTGMTRLYRDVMLQRCTLEQEVFKNTLTLATQAPDDFAFLLMKGPGYMSVFAGEVAHIIPCIPVEVNFRKTDECYLQLPVLKNNQTQFLTPRTHILIHTGIQTTCNPFMPFMYKTGQSWYRVVPNPTEFLPSEIMQPMIIPTWKYKNPASLATSGIYSQEDLDTSTDHIMFPAEKSVVLNIIAHGIMGHATLNQGASLINLLDEKTLNI